MIPHPPSALSFGSCSFESHLGSSRVACMCHWQHFLFKVLLHCFGTWRCGGSEGILKGCWYIAQATVQSSSSSENKQRNEVEYETRTKTFLIGWQRPYHLVLLALCIVSMDRLSVCDNLGWYFLLSIQNWDEAERLLNCISFHGHLVYSKTWKIFISMFATDIGGSFFKHGSLSVCVFSLGSWGWDSDIAQTFIFYSKAPYWVELLPFSALESSM